MKTLAPGNKPSSVSNALPATGVSSTRPCSLPLLPCPSQQLHVAFTAPNSSSSSSNASHAISKTRRGVVARVYSPMLDDDLADRTREVWDDEEDIMATAEKLGYNRTNSAADSGPLITDVNEWYTEQQKRPKESFLGQVELRYIPGKGYGLVATHDVHAGTVLAVCLPLAWVSGPPGQPPPLEALVRLLKSSSFTAQQRRVLASLCSSPDLDGGHEADVMQRQQELQQVGFSCAVA